MSYLSSTLGKKLLVGFAGLGLSVFVLAHMLGNLLLFAGPKAFNTYAHTLTTHPLIYVAEVGLVCLFLLHVVLALWLTLYNFWAKGRGICASRCTSSPQRTKASLASRSLHYQGVVILVFLIYHLVTFKFGPDYQVTYGDLVMRDIFRVVVESFQKPLVVAGYIFSLVLLCMHLSHGLASSLQTLGLKSTAKVKLAGHIYAFLVTLGFISQPLYVCFFY